jgi:penicillin-binding protein 1A
VIAGKTGTTQSNSDAWFVGVTPNLLGVVWVGCDEPSIHFATTGAGQGASAALPIWALFFKKVYADRSLKIRPSDSFDAPDGFTTDTTGALIPVLVDSLSSDDAIAP